MPSEIRCLTVNAANQLTATATPGNRFSPEPSVVLYVTVNVALGSKGLIPDLIGHLHPERVRPRFKRFQGQQLLHRHLASSRPCRALTSSLNSKTFWFEPFFMISYSIVPFGFWVVSILLEIVELHVDAHLLVAA